MNAKSIVVLSTKSSGSSALQRLLCASAGAQHIEHTRHGEYETLYWTKAASILGLKQAKIPDSEVPLPATRARLEFYALLQDNLPNFVPPADPRELIFHGWGALCRRYAPVFVEKSPHHLHQWSCLQLLSEAVKRLPDVDFLFIGLVRNPMDTLYSSWKRWRALPQQHQFHWLTAYENLIRFRELIGDRLIIVRYESLVNQDATARSLYGRLGIKDIPADVSMHPRSVLKWTRDPTYGFQLDTRVANLARELGYTDQQLRSDYREHPKVYWLVQRVVHRGLFAPQRRLRARIRRWSSAAK